MSKMVVGTKKLGEELAAWNDGLDEVFQTGSNFRAGKAVSPARVRRAIDELMSFRSKLIERGKGVTSIDVVIQRLSNALHKSELRDNPTKSGGMTAAEARKAIPTGEIGFIVDRYHVGEGSDVVGEDIKKRGMKAGWPLAAVRAAVEYAKKRHEDNRETYNAVMSGNLGGASRKKRTR